MTHVPGGGGAGSFQSALQFKSGVHFVSLEQSLMEPATVSSVSSGELPRLGIFGRAWLAQCSSWKSGSPDEPFHWASNGYLLSVDRRTFKWRAVRGGKGVKLPTLKA